MPTAISACNNRITASLLQNYLQTIDCVRARLQSCRNWPIAMPALATTELQISENKPAGAKAQRDLFALSARLKSCPDTLCSFNGILQDAPATELSVSIGELSVQPGRDFVCLHSGVERSRRRENPMGASRKRFEGLATDFPPMARMPKPAVAQSAKAEAARP